MRTSLLWESSLMRSRSPSDSERDSIFKIDDLSSVKYHSFIIISSLCCALLEDLLMPKSEARNDR